MGLCQVLCHWQLPPAPVLCREVWFQTKDIDHEDRTYVIAESGHLLLEHWDKTLEPLLDAGGAIEIWAQIEDAEATWEYRVWFECGRVVNARLVQFEAPGHEAINIDLGD